MYSQTPQSDAERRNEQFDVGINLYAKRNYQNAIPFLLTAEKLGHQDAAEKLSSAYYRLELEYLQDKAYEEALWNKRL